MVNSFSDGPMSGQTKMFCNFCNHERIHIGGRPIIWCCVKEFLRQHDLKKHEKTNSGKNKFGSSNKTKDKKFERDRDKPFSCSFCDYKCNQLSTMKAHEWIHTGDKPIHCSKCDYKCRRTSDLKEHDRIHTGDKPYCCPHCDKKFVQAGQLKKHERVHTGERPYKCNYCPKRFSDGSNLKRHEKSCKQRKRKKVAKPVE